MSHTAPSALPMFKTEAGRDRYLTAYNAVLADWPVPYEELDVPTRLGSARVVASGPKGAPPVVLLPSFAGSATLWRPNVAALSEHFRVLAVDVVGQPGKSQCTRRIADRQDYAGWFTDLLDGLGIARTSIVGASFGGFLALNQAILTPERVHRVVMISPPGTFVPLSWRFIVAMLSQPLRRALLRLVGIKRTPAVTDLLGKDARLAPADEAWGALMSIAMTDSGRASIISPAVFTDAELATIRAPALLLIGDQERLYEAHATLKRALSRMPGLEGAVIANAHHLAALAQPEDVNARVLEFLQRGSPA